ncbi:MAG: hypothetical protein O7G85_12730 [Planctomycetota bacterium]|nr:hypothetical protein [Planctomycetota bacterium]
MTRTRDPFDDLAAMFLTDADQAAENAQDPQQARKIAIELLMVAHLPVRGGLWLTPYADGVARTTGPTALLRLDGDHPSLQQLRGLEETGAPQEDLTLREAIDELMTESCTWIIRPSMRTSSTKLLQAGVDRITILTSADDAAVVAAYQAIKNLFDEFDADVSCMPPIGIAIVGSELEQAQDMLDRLNATTEAHLGITLSMTLCLPRMDAGILSTRYLSFNEEDSPPLSKAVRMIDEARRGVNLSKTAPLQNEIETTELQEEESPATEVLEFPSLSRDSFEATLDIQDAWLDEPVEGAMPTEEEARLDEDLVETDVGFTPRTLGIVEVLRARVEDDGVRIEPEFTPGIPTPGTSGTPAPGSTGTSSTNQNQDETTVKVKPKPVIEVEPKENLTPREPHGVGGMPPSLAQHVDGLIPILPRCPGHEHVEMALDVAGRMHLLTKEEFLRDLFVVEPWAKAHRELIAMASPDQKIDPRGKIVKHVFTAEPISVSDLHTSDIRLHVLAPVKVKDETGWYSAPLNPAAV